MKTIQITFAVVAMTLYVGNEIQAQDMIYKSDGTPIECKIESIDSNNIIYLPSKKSGKSQTIKTIQTSLVVFENGQYVTFPDPKQNVETLKSKLKLKNDVVITKFAEIIEGKVSSVSESKVDIVNIQTNTKTSVKSDEAIMIIYSNGEHKLFKKAPDVKVMLEFMQPHIIAIVDVKTGNSATSNQEVATGRPSYLTGTKTTSNPSTPSSVEAETTANDRTQDNLNNFFSQQVAQPNPVVKPQITQPVSSPVVNTVVPANQVVTTTTYQVVTQPAHVLPVTQPELTPKPSSSTFSNNGPSELTNIDFDEFSDKALHKIDDFTGYIEIIASKETYPESSNQAIDLAIELFVSEDAVVEVSTTGFNASVKRKIRDYLNRLKLLKYDKVDIQWADINYVSNFRMAPDGNYYGTVSVKQTFRGYKDNQVVYSDVTQKDVEVVIKGMEKSINGQKEMVWDVLLSDIGVVDTK